VTAALLLAVQPADAELPPATLAQPVAFSRLQPGAAFAPWTPVDFGVGKRPTRYDLVVDGGSVVLHAVADNAASGMLQRIGIDTRQAPMIAWRWKIAGLIARANPRVASREDAPARIVLEFDGDKSRLGLTDRALFRIGARVMGREIPYATIVYIWSNDLPVGTVIPNPHTHRIQMIVASTGAAGVGHWESLTRDVRADFRRAFGEDAGPLDAVGVLTDTDNTDAHAEAWYGDIGFMPEIR
jgi:hypothetical protein